MKDYIMLLILLYISNCCNVAELCLIKNKEKAKVLIKSTY